MISFRQLAFCTVALCAFASPALSEGDDLRIDEAWKAALLDFEGVVTEKQHAILNVVAYSAASARLCDGLDLDADKVGKAINDIVAPANDDADDDVKVERLTNVLVTLGTAKGIFLAEGALHKDKFCESAMTAKADPEYVGFWK